MGGRGWIEMYLRRETSFWSSLSLCLEERHRPCEEGGGRRGEDG